MRGPQSMHSLPGGASVQHANSRSTEGSMGQPACGHAAPARRPQAAPHLSPTFSTPETLLLHRRAGQVRYIGQQEPLFQLQCVCVEGLQPWPQGPWGN
jgi:hypothetical protein